MSCFHELRPRGFASRQCINPIASQPDSQLEKSWKTLRPRCQELGEVDRRRVQRELIDGHGFSSATIFQHRWYVLRVIGKLTT